MCVEKLRTMCETHTHTLSLSLSLLFDTTDRRSQVREGENRTSAFILEEGMEDRKGMKCRERERDTWKSSKDERPTGQNMTEGSPGTFWKEEVDAPNTVMPTHLAP